MRVLISCTQYPYFGGAATNAYALIKYFRKLGYPTAGIFFEAPGKFEVDPDRIGGVFLASTGLNPREQRRSRDQIINFLGGVPELSLGKNYVAPVLAKRLFPKAQNVYLVSGSPVLTQLSQKRISAVKFLQDSSKPPKFPQEAKCIAASDFIIPNSTILRESLIQLYPSQKNITIPIDTSSILNGMEKGNRTVSIPFSKRKYDVAFICSKMSRTIKNPSLAQEIFASPQLSSLRKLVIGEGSGVFKHIPNTHTLGLLNHKEILGNLSNTKVLICPSFFDASPNVVREAIEQGCNVLISKNCGWAEKYPEESVCEDVYQMDEWVAKLTKLTQSSISFQFKTEQTVQEQLNKLGLLNNLGKTAALTTPDSNDSVKRVLFVADVRNWAYDFTAKNWAKQIASQFEVDIIYLADFSPKDQRENPQSIFNHEDYDAILFFYSRGHTDVRLRNTPFPLNKCIICLNNEKWTEIGALEFYKKYLIRAGAVVACNQFIMDEFVPFHSNLFKVPQAIDEDIFKRSQDIKEPEPFIVGWSGNPDNPYKSIEVLKKAQKILGFELSIAHDKTQEELNKWYQSVNVVVCTSRSEGGPLMLLEAGACGIPVITTRVGIARELIHHKVNGFLLDTCSLDEVIHGLSYVKENYEEAQSWGKELREEVLKSWTYPKRKKILNHLFQSVTS